MILPGACFAAHAMYRPSRASSPTTSKQLSFKLAEPQTPSKRSNPFLRNPLPTNKTTTAAVGIFQSLNKYFVRTTPTAQHILGHHPPKADDDVAIEFLHDLRSAQSKTPELGGSAKG